MFKVNLFILSLKNNFSSLDYILYWIWMAAQITVDFGELSFKNLAV